MAARHAGFAAVCCLDEALANNIIEAVFLNAVAPLTFRLPTPIAVGGTSVILSGQFTVLPPVVTFTRRPDNLVAVRTRFVSDLRLEGATQDPVDVAIELGCSLVVGLSVAVVNDRFQVGLDLSKASVNAVDLRVIDGPSLVSGYGAALQSGPVLATLTDVLRSIPFDLVRITINGFPATVTVAPKQMPCGASLFELPEMFHASFSISRVVLRLLDHQVALGLDIAGITNGDPNALETLFGVRRSIWVRVNGPEGPVEFSPKEFLGGGNAALSINPDALVRLLEGPLSQATLHAFVDCHVALEGLSMGFETFSPNLMPYVRIAGATMRVGARYYDAPGRDPQSRLTPGGASIHADSRTPFAVHYQTFDGPTAFISGRTEYWFVKVYDGEIDVPWWVTFGLVLIGIAVPVLALPVVAILDGILPELLANAASQVTRNAQAGINGAVSEFGLASSRTTFTIPSLPKTPCTEWTPLISITGDGIDFYSDLALATRTDTSRDRNLIVIADCTRVRDGEDMVRGVVEVYPIVCTVQVKDGIIDPMDLSVRVSWEVRRSDAGIVIQQDLPYWSPRIAMLTPGDGPSARRIVIDRTRPELMPAPEFVVTLRVYRPLYGRVKEYGYSRFKITIFDRFDRNLPYVHWKGWANGVPKQSAIHRTAVPGRCLMMNRAAGNAQFLYLEELPFPVAEINEHRKEICEYCFFGGPEKQIPLI